MEYPREKLIRQVLLELGILDANEAPEAEDFEDVNAAADQKLEELYEDGLIPFNLDGDIPSRYMRPLTCLIAFEVAGQYGVDLQAAAAKASDGMKRLFKLAEKPDTGIVVRADYF